MGRADGLTAAEQLRESKLHAEVTTDKSSRSQGIRISFLKKKFRTLLIFRHRLFLQINTSLRQQRLC